MSGMPVHSVEPPTGKKGPCYQWGGHGKVYCGPNGEANARTQERAAYANGYGKDKP